MEETGKKCGEAEMGDGRERERRISERRGKDRIGGEQEKRGEQTMHAERRGLKGQGERGEDWRGGRGDR